MPDSTEARTIPETGAFTVEPRLSAPGLPTVSFHIVVAFDQGRKQVISELDPLFELAGMEMLPPEFDTWG